MTDHEIIESIESAQDKIETIQFDGNMISSTEISSVTVGKRATFYYRQDGGFISYAISDI
jgi:hypothetical protein